MRNICKSVIEKPERKSHLREPEVDRRVCPTFDKIRKALFHSLLALQPCVGLAFSRAVLCILAGGFVNSFFPGWFRKLHTEPPTWRTRDYTLSGLCALTCLAWVALPGAYAPASTAIRVIGANRSPLQDKAVVLEDFIM
jgi:hypothetical protein